jgi:short-subunit dehydrogenase
MNKSIFFFSGISSGLGKALAQSVIDNGDFIIVIFRSQIHAHSIN